MMMMMRLNVYCNTEARTWSGTLVNPVPTNGIINRNQHYLVIIIIIIVMDMTITMVVSIVST
jgi:hypothetical protein